MPSATESGGTSGSVNGVNDILRLHSNERTQAQSRDHTSLDQFA
jgi:hypothetical protein